MTIVTRREAKKRVADISARVAEMTASFFYMDAANDNEQSYGNASHKRLSPPTMHPEPFTPESAGGILADVSRWITSTAIIPVPELSLAAALSLLGGMFGDKALGPTRTGVNLFFVTVMPVASGKGHAPKAISALAREVGKPGAVTNGDPTSYAAIERILRRNKSTVIVMDEFGVTLQDVNSRQKNSAAASIRKFLLAIYDQADSTFDGRQYASGETKKDDAPIEGPALTVLGMTVASSLYAGLSADSISEGFLSRFVFVAGSAPESILPPKLSRVAKTPAALLTSLREAVDKFPKSESGGNISFLGKYIVPFQGGEDGDAFSRWSEVFMWQHWKGWSKRESDINGRVAENTLRLATLRAISRSPSSPAVTAEDVEWGWAVVYSSIGLIGEGVRTHMAGSTFEALRKAIEAALSAAKDGTLPWSHLLQRDGVSQADPDEVSKALQWLIETGRVASVVKQSKPGPKGRFKLVVK